jgi:hypothetical protein
VKKYRSRVIISSPGKFPLPRLSPTSKDMDRVNKSLEGTCGILIGRFPGARWVTWDHILIIEISSIKFNKQILSAMQVVSIRISTTKSHDGILGKRGYVMICLYEKISRVLNDWLSRTSELDNLLLIGYRNSTTVYTSYMQDNEAQP